MSVGCGTYEGFLQGVFSGPALKVLSVEDGEIPSRKVKVKVKTSHFSVTHLYFHFFGGDFAIFKT